MPKTHDAVVEGSLNPAKDLLIEDVQVDTRDNVARAPLHLAAGKGSEERDTGDAPLHGAIENENETSTDIYSNRNADVNLRTSDESSPLHHAISSRHIILAEKLLDQGADVDITDNDGKSPLCLAIETGLHSIVEKILQRSRNTDDKLALEAAVRGFGYKYDATLKILIKYGFSPGSDICGNLVTAVTNGDYETVERLINNGANPNSIQYGMSLLHQAIFRENSQMVKLLIELGCDINAKSQGRYPIYHALQKACEDSAELLLTNGCKIEDSDELLHYAAGYDYVNICRILLDRGVDVNVRDSEGRTALHYARMDCVIDFLVQSGADINCRDKRGLTPVHRAVEEAGHFFESSILNCLLNYDIDIAAQDDRGNTALHIACIRPDEPELEMVEVLLRHGYDVNATNKQGMTPLELAIDHRNRSEEKGEAEWYLHYYNLVILRIVEQIVKINEAGLYVCEGNIRGLDMGAGYAQECRKEVERIRRTKVNNNHISLYDALIKCNVPRLSEELIETLKSINYKEFPVYGSMMQVNLKNGQKRSELISLAKDSAYALMQREGLPFEIMERIVCELENRDLQSLISCSSTKSQHVSVSS